MSGAEEQVVYQASGSLVQAEATPPWMWMVMGLCAAISALSLYIAKQAEKRRKDDKESRDMLVEIVRDNTKAMTKLTAVVDRVQNTLDLYIHTER